jgi:putative flippase GtrA
VVRRLRTFFLFCVAGALGFVVDAGIVQSLVSLLDWNPYFSRLLSFLAAATATWLFNRHYTFRGRRHYSLRGEWLRYLAAMGAGFAVNFSVYSYLVFHYAFVQKYPALGVAAGSVAGLAINFISSRYWVFRTR